MKDNIIQATISVVLGALASYFNVLLIPVLVLVAVMVIDYATGMTSAYKRADRKQSRFTRNTEES